MVFYSMNLQAGEYENGKRYQSDADMKQIEDEVFKFLLMAQTHLLQGFPQWMADRGGY